MDNIGTIEFAASTVPKSFNRWQSLRAATSSSHESLDALVMRMRPFESIVRYGLFLQCQYQFHGLLRALYHRPELTVFLPDLTERDRFELIKQDLADLGLSAPELADPSDMTTSDTPTALGWLYVVEGSNLGAAFLIKEARKLGLSESHGARHLAGHPDGRGKHWRSFTESLNDIDLPPADEARVISGAIAAFETMRAIVLSRVES